MGAALAPSPPERARSLIALHLSSFACAWPRQSLWQLPPPAARFLCAAVIYTHSKSSASLHPARRYHDGLSCSLAHGSGEYIGKAIGSHDHAKDRCARVYPGETAACAPKNTRGLAKVASIWECVAVVWLSYCEAC